MNLYPIDKKYEEILEKAVNPETGEFDDSYLPALFKVEEEREKAMLSAFYFTQNLNTSIDSISSAIQMMQKRKARMEAQKEKMHNDLIKEMQNRGISKISCPYFEIGLKKCPISVEIHNESDLPSVVKRTKTTTTITPDKAAIKELILAGVNVPGASLKQNMRLEIK